MSRPESRCLRFLLLLRQVLAACPGLGIAVHHSCASPVLPGAGNEQRGYQGYLFLSTSSLMLEREGWLTLHIYAQDGYAVRSTQGPGDYEVAFEALAGHPQSVLEESFVAYISTGTHCKMVHQCPMTFTPQVPSLKGFKLPTHIAELWLCIIGGPLPKGADAVVQIENTEQLPLAPSGNRRVKILQVCLKLDFHGPFRHAGSQPTCMSPSI